MRLFYKVYKKMQVKSKSLQSLFLSFVKLNHHDTLIVDLLFLNNEVVIPFTTVYCGIFGRFVWITVSVRARYLSLSHTTSARCQCISGYSLPGPTESI